MNILSETDSLLILKSVSPYSEPLHILVKILPLQMLFTIWRVYYLYQKAASDRGICICVLGILDDFKSSMGIHSFEEFDIGRPL